EKIELMTITDMTTLAKLAGYIPPTPPTIWLNFDGHTPPPNSKDSTVLPFQDGASDRDQQIQDILFLTSELFAPFNVKVERTLKPAEIQPHDKQIFVGQVVGANAPFGVTPGASTDYPRASYYQNQGPNTHTYDEAFVDPFDANGVKKWTDTQI